MSVRLPLALPLVAIAVLALSGCKKDQPAAAPQASRDCCCKQSCPTDAAPAAKAEARAEAGSTVVTRSGARRQVAQRTSRTRGYAGGSTGTLSGADYYASGDTAGRRYQGGYTGRETGEAYTADERRYAGGYTGRETGRSYAGGERRYEGGGYGGRYGASGRAVSGVSISVEESETSSERVRYRESSSGYASGSSGSYAAGYGRGGAAYAATGYYEDRDGRVRRAGPAATDRSGYLTWPGKVEEED